jgi:hypothetical protein
MILTLNGDSKSSQAVRQMPDFSKQVKRANYSKMSAPGPLDKALLSRAFRRRPSSIGRDSRPKGSGAAGILSTSRGRLQRRKNFQNVLLGAVGKWLQRETRNAAVVAALIHCEFYAGDAGFGDHGAGGPG